MEKAAEQRATAALIYVVEGASSSVGGSVHDAGIHHAATATTASAAITSRRRILGAQAKWSNAGDVGALVAEVLGAISRAVGARSSGQAVAVVHVQVGNAEAIERREAAFVMALAGTRAEREVTSARALAAEHANARIEAVAVGVLRIVEVAAHDAEAGAHAHVHREALNAETNACARVCHGRTVAKLTHGQAGLRRIDAHAYREITLATRRALPIVATSRQTAERRAGVIKRRACDVFTTMALELVEWVVEVHEVGAFGAALHADSFATACWFGAGGREFVRAIGVGRALHRAEAIGRTATQELVVVARLHANTLRAFFGTHGVVRAGQTEPIAGQRRSARATRRAAARRRRGRRAFATRAARSDRIRLRATRRVHRDNGSKSDRRQKPPCTTQFHCLPPRTKGRPGHPTSGDTPHLLDAHSIPM